MAGMIPRPFIDDLLARIDIVDVIDKRVPLKKAGSNYKACCPFHGEKTPSFTVSQSKQFYHCFGCGVNGSAITFLMEYEQLDFPDAIEELAKSIGIEVPREESPEQTKQRKQSASLYELLALATRYYETELKRSTEAIEYLKHRGVSGATAKQYAIGFVPESWDYILKHIGTDAEHQEKLDTAGMLIKKDNGGFYDRFRNRIMFPIRDPRGKHIGFGGRVMGDGEPKYLNSPETPLFHKGRELYGLFEAKQHNKSLDAIIVVEGYMDVIMLAEHGISNAVATLGTACTPEHVTRLFRLVDDVIFCFDGDRAGKAAAWQALNRSLSALQDGKSIRFLFLPDGEDPDSLVQSEGRDAFVSRMKKATALSEYLLNHLMTDNAMASGEDIAKLVHDAKPLLEQITAPTLKSLIENQIAHHAGTSKDHLFPPTDSAQPTVPQNTPQSSLSAWNVADAQSSAPALNTPKNIPAIIHKEHRVQMGNKRVLIAALLQEPKLALTVSDMELDIIEPYADAGVKFIIDLIEQIKTEPNIRGIALLERYRGSNMEQGLKELLNHEFELGESDSGANIAAVTFQDGFKKIFEAARQMMYSDLCLKPRSLLTNIDKAFLKNFHDSS